MAAMHDKQKKAQLNRGFGEVLGKEAARSGDAELKAKWARVTDPVEALRQIVDHDYFFGVDPYYRDLHRALMEMASRIVDGADRRA